MFKKMYVPKAAWVSLIIFLLLSQHAVRRSDFPVLVDRTKDQWPYHIPAVNISKGYGIKVGAIDELDDYKLEYAPQHAWRVRQLQRQNGQAVYGPQHYMLFLGGIYKVFGVRPDIASVIQMLLFVAALSLLPYLGDCLFGRIGIFIGMAAVFLYYNFFTYDYISLSPEALVLFLLAVYAILWARWEGKFTAPRLLILGIWIALCNLIKGTTIFIPILSMIFIFNRLQQNSRSQRLKGVIFFLAGYLLLVAPWNIYTSAKRRGIVVFSTNWENVLLDTHNEDALRTGKWEPAWRKKKSVADNYFYNQPQIRDLPAFEKMIRFMLLHKNRLPQLYWRKLWFAFSTYPPAFYTIIFLILYYVMIGLIKKKEREDSDGIAAVADSSREPSPIGLIYLLNLLLIIVIFFGPKRFINEFVPFFLLWALYFPLYLFALMQKRIIQHQA